MSLRHVQKTGKKHSDLTCRDETRKVEPDGSERSSVTGDHAYPGRGTYLTQVRGSWTYEYEGEDSYYSIRRWWKDHGA